MTSVTPGAAEGTVAMARLVAGGEAASAPANRLVVPVQRQPAGLRAEAVEAAVVFAEAGVPAASW